MNTIMLQESNDAWVGIYQAGRVRHFDCQWFVGKGYLGLATLRNFSEFFPMEDKFQLHSNYFIKDTDCHSKVCYRLA